MNIVVLGASGGTGRLIVEQALAAGHEVVAFVRTPAKLALRHPKLTVIQGEVLNAEQVTNAIARREAIVSAIGPTRPYQPNLLETTARNITTAMQKHGVRRLIVTGGTIIRDPQDRPSGLDNLIKALMSIPGREILSDGERSDQVIRATALDWTIVRYLLMLTNGPRIGQYRTGYLGHNVSLRLSRADGADFIIQELASGKFIRKAPVVSY